MLFFLSIISAVNSSVFAVASLLAVAICSSFSSARRTGKHLPPVPASVLPGCQPGCLQASPSRTPRRSVDKAVLLAAGIFTSLPWEPSRNGCSKGQSCSQAQRLGHVLRAPARRRRASHRSAAHFHDAYSSREVRAWSCSEWSQ